jgi:hypothetical protein
VPPLLSHQNEKANLKTTDATVHKKRNGVHIKTNKNQPTYVHSQASQYRQNKEQRGINIGLKKELKTLKPSAVPHSPGPVSHVSIPTVSSEP